MLKVLVASENIEQNSQYCNYLAKDKDLEVISTNDGITTLNKYFSLRPNILILDTFFSDLNYTDIIDKITNLDDESSKCNTILTVNKDIKNLDLRNVEKVYSILTEPENLRDLSQALSNMKNKCKYADITIDEINVYLSRLYFNLGSNATNYMRSAIFYCYYNRTAIKSLDSIYNFIAKEYSIDAKTVKAGIRSSLVPLNTYRSIKTHNKLLNIFDIYEDNITPKQFLKTFVTYLRYKKIRNKLIDFILKLISCFFIYKYTLYSLLIFPLLFLQMVLLLMH